MFEGDPEASFTKEQMHAGKHQEYEKKLHEALLNKAATQSTQSEVKQTVKNKESATTSIAAPSNNTNKENWPQLNQDKAETVKTEKKPEPVKENKAKSKSKNKTFHNNNNSIDKKLEKGKNCETVCQNQNDTRQNIEKIEPTEVKEEKPTNGDIIESAVKIPPQDDNSSFFSQSSFQKVVSETGEPECVLGENLLDINSTEDWEAAFGFSKHSNHLEELAKQRNNVKGTLEMFGNGFGAVGNQTEHNGFPQNGYNIKWLQENVIDVLSSGKNGLPVQNGYQEERVHSNGLDHQMSKFFTDFCKQNVLTSVDHQNYFMMHHKQQLEEQLLNLNLKSGYNQHGVNSSQFLNGDILNTQNGSGYGQFSNQMYPGSASVPVNAKNRMHAEDELDFDPFQETQKALAELIENEQNHKMHGKNFVIIQGVSKH